MIFNGLNGGIKYCLGLSSDYGLVITSFSIDNKCCGRTINTIKSSEREFILDTLSDSVICKTRCHLSLREIWRNIIDRNVCGRVNISRMNIVKICFTSEIFCDTFRLNSPRIGIGMKWKRKLLIDQSCLSRGVTNNRSKSIFEKLSTKWTLQIWEYYQCYCRRCRNRLYRFIFEKRLDRLSREMIWVLWKRWRLRDYWLRKKDIEIIQYSQPCLIFRDKPRHNRGKFKGFWTKCYWIWLKFGNRSIKGSTIFTGNSMINNKTARKWVHHICLPLSEAELLKILIETPDRSISLYHPSWRIKWDFASFEENRECLCTSDKIHRTCLRIRTSYHPPICRDFDCPTNPIVWGHIGEILFTGIIFW